MSEQTPLGSVVRRFTCPGLSMEQPDSLVACYRVGHECRATSEELRDEYGVVQRSFCGCCGEQYSSMGVPRQLLAEWRAAQPEPDQYPQIQGTCPSCGVGPLFRAEGGHVTCSWVDCRAPEAADALLHAGQPDRPEPVDPASVRVGDVVDIEPDDAAWYIKARVTWRGDSGFMVAIPGDQTGFDFGAGINVRILRRAEPEPEPVELRPLMDRVRAFAPIGVDVEELALEMWHCGARVSTDA